MSDDEMTGKSSSSTDISSESDEEINLEIDLLNHVLLPRYLPQHAQSYEHELQLLQRMVELIEVQDEWIPKETIEMLRNMMEIQVNCLPETISEQINALTPGKTFAMYVRNQHSVFVIYMPANEIEMPNEATTVIVATFPSDVDPKIINKTIDDFEVHLPVQALKVKFSHLLRSIKFANQLSTLHHEVPRCSSINFNFVSNWLVTALCDEDAEMAETDEFPVVVKKLRDEILGDSHFTAFRRSRLYMCMKSLLQHNLTMHLGAETGKLIYKGVMLQFITKMCDAFAKPTTFDVGVMNQLMAKLARRVEKLSDLMGNLNDHLSEIIRCVINHTQTAIKTLRTKVDGDIERLQSEDEKNAQLPPLTELNFETDVIQKVPKLREYLENRASDATSFHRTSEKPRKHLRLKFDVFNAPAPLANHFDDCSDKTKVNLRLVDLEKWNLYHSDGVEINAKTIRYLSDLYAKAAESFYEGDPFATSTMILVRLKLISMLDKIACKEIPLMLKFRSGINPNIIRTLLLHHRIDLQVAHELEEYFTKRNNYGSGPSLIEEKTVSEVSFAAEYAARNGEMQSLRTTILENTKSRIVQLQCEHTEIRNKVCELRTMERTLEHKKYTGVGEKCHNCKKCRLKRLVKGKKVNQYMKLLPEREYEQNAIVFELLIPDNVAQLRDILYNFAEYCNETPNNALNISADWVKSLNVVLNSSRSVSTNVILGMITHVQPRKLHVDIPVDNFVLENTSSLVYYQSNSNTSIPRAKKQKSVANKISMPAPITNESVKRRCTLKIETESDYGKLQWTINRTLHTQNQVIASQSECPDGMSFAEYKNFGSLRADGHRLQWHKLYAMIECEGLSFEQPSVLSLILQTIWECEEKGQAGLIRESSAYLGSATFARKFLELLDKFMEQQKDNWVHPLKLLMASFLNVRIMEINDDESAADEAARLLDKLRIRALDWIKRIQQAISDIRSPDQTMEQSLRMKLAIVSIAGAVTFFIHPSHRFYEKILQKNTQNGYTAHRTWLEFVITLNNNIALSCGNEVHSMLNMTMLLRLVQRIGVQLQPSLTKMLNTSCSDLIQLIKKQWRRAGENSLKATHFDFVCPQIWRAEINEAQISIDIVTGEFWVNDMPVARLPKIISEHPLYQRIFQNFIFEVQPEDTNIFVSVQRFNERTYKFSWIDDYKIVITECRDDGTEWELLPTDVLDDEVPHFLVQNHSHWLQRHQDIVTFRPKLFSDKNFIDTTAIEYHLDLKSSNLKHSKSGRSLLDVTSDSYRKIVHQLERLECPSYIIILLDTPKIATIELTRMNLKFRVDISDPRTEEYDVLSNEFSQMRVALRQKCGTLYGLNHGLLLEQRNSTEPPALLLLLPHSLIYAERTKDHVTINIDTKYDLHKPPFQLYRIDYTCRQLKSINNSYSAWLYLAFLHAITSHGEIEPFTGISGTESALHILQSGYAWSSSPYEDEVVQLLQDFSDLSPKRNIDNGTTQTIDWPKFIPAHAAQDSYVFMATTLLEESERLYRLYFGESVSIKLGTDLQLNKRDYLRHLELMPNLRVSTQFIQSEAIQTKLQNATNIRLLPKARTLSMLYHNPSYKILFEFDLWTFLTETATTLIGIEYKDSIVAILNHAVIDELVHLWISLYEAIRTGLFTEEEFALIWSLLAYRDADYRAILTLQTIERNRTEFSEIEAPEIDSYDLSDGWCFKKSDVVNILEMYEEDASVERNDWIGKLADAIESEWPCESFDIETFNSADGNNLNDGYEANNAIDSKLFHWFQNLKLKNFIEEVEAQLDSLEPSNSYVPPLPLLFTFAYNQPSALNWSKYEVNFEPKLAKIPSRFDPDIDEARKVWEFQYDSSKSSEQWWEVYNNIIEKQIDTYFVDARMHPRSVPSLVLPKLLLQTCDDRMKMVIGALAISITREQREKRLATLKFEPNFDREDQNQPHINWKPCDYPEWLLFEIEQNLTIRTIQIEIAKRMISPPEIAVKHSTMQLNMGEGKTAVIVPILAAVLANGEQVCQITVLKSLYATNLKSIRQYLGGMLNRRIYIFPCRRDMPISEHINDVLDIYKECQVNKGVVMSLSEHQLSFQLKMYELIKKGDHETANQFLTVQKWLNTNIRSILDESDAILHPKYQLIYTVGNQLSLDGGVQRWFVMQAILKRVPYHMNELYRNNSDAIEFNEKYYLHDRPDVFTPCRIIKDSVYGELKAAIIDDLFADRLDIILPEMNTATRTNVQQFWNQQSNVSFATISTDLALDVQNAILIVNGLLQFDVLKLMLQKRWRVNYGINKKGQRKMAVPFRAKDVAAELTEFGHPDVAVGLTHLSYYYSGLTDVQLHQVFRILTATQSASEIYEKWIQNIPPEFIDESIKCYTGVNLCDPHQRDGLLFPLFRYSMNVIDFWLSKVVFPNEAKTFDSKLMCTAWDLCSDQMNHRVTGFSGTNDTKNILPLPIAQNDLLELEQTNENVRKILERLENQNYEKLKANVSAKEILELLVKRDIPVLLDPGALMLELNNKHVAENWLKLASTKYEAAVYFDADDVLQTIDRNDTIAEFDCSVYRENLARCLVYLDDTHTRGTDLKFPANWRACVTLSGEITRDKTVQACMRMRQLEKSHSIAFWASFEADLRTREMCRLSTNDQLTNGHVMQFISSNSERFEMENMVHWVNASHNYTRKIAGHKLHEETNSLLDLYEGCENREYATLRDMYSDKEEETLRNITCEKYDRLINTYSNNEIVSDFIRNAKTAVGLRLSGPAADIKRYVHMMDEEQEKEIDYEPEQQRQIDRPGVVRPWPHVNEDFEALQRLIQYGLNAQIGTILLPIKKALEYTKLAREYVNDFAFSDNIFVTRDFINVIRTPSRACDEYLRPVWWIASVEGRYLEAPILILMSSLQSDCLLPSFKQSVSSTLYMFRPLLSKLHSELVDQTDLRITGKTDTVDIDAYSLAQIKVYSGSMYFKNQKEQNAYCHFLGLIPRPRTIHLEEAFDKGIIKPNGFVPLEHRQYSTEILNCVGRCKFVGNPVNLATKLIEAHHQFVRKDSHAALILERGLMSQVPCIDLNLFSSK